MDVLTPAYAHLEFDSKLKSAGKMTWIADTSLAGTHGRAANEVCDQPLVQETPATETPIQDGSSIIALPDFMQSLFVLGVSPEVVQAWIKQADFTNGVSLTDSFRVFQDDLRV
jgi:hypothetical protein